MGPERQALANSVSDCRWHVLIFVVLEPLNLLCRCFLERLLVEEHLLDLRKLVYLGIHLGLNILQDLVAPLAKFFGKEACIVLPGR